MSYKDNYPPFEADQRKWYAEAIAWLALLKRAEQEGNSFWIKIYADQAKACMKGVIGFEHEV